MHQKTLSDSGKQDNLDRENPSLRLGVVFAIRASSQKATPLPPTMGESNF